MTGESRDDGPTDGRTDDATDGDAAEARPTEIGAPDPNPSDPGPSDPGPHPEAQSGGAARPPRPHDRHMLTALVCPVTRAPLTYDAQAQELISRAAHLAFPIRDGIPIMLVDEARKID